jgi:mannose-1-phosphate guanylyltransferase/phosphomannomutase
MNKPVMEHIINLLKKCNIVDIGVTLQYMPDVIKDYFGDGSDFGVNISYFVEDKPLGTAGSVKNAQDFLDDTFLVISGDALTDIDVTKAVEFHKKKRSIATLILTKVEVPLEYGVVITEDDGRIKGFLEKPSWSEVFSDTVNTGIYVLEPQCLSYFELGQVFDFSNNLFPIILSKGLPMYGYVTSDYWCDVGDLKAYQQCHFDILDGKVKINIPGYQIQGKIWVDEGVEIDKDCNINGPVVIGANCKIKRNSKIEPYCILGSGNTLDENVSLKKTIILNGCNIGQKCQLRGTIVCNKVNVKDNCSIFESSVVGDNTLISEQVSIKPNIKIWPNKFIDYGCEVNNNLIWGTKCTKNLFGKKGIIGKANSEITTEFMSKLGSAFAEVFKKTSKLGISYDNSPISSMLKASFIAGMMSVGVEVYDLGQLILPITRDAIKFYTLDGGVHIGLASNDKSSINICFLDKTGLI